MSRSCDVVVVGGGAMGSAAAWWLAAAGRDVVLLEQFEPGHVRGSSHGSSRIFRLAYPDRTYVAMAQAALPLWRQLEDEVGGAGLLRTVGGIDHGYEPSVAEVADALAAEGVAHTWLSPRDAAEQWPEFAFETPVLFQPDAGCVDANATVAALQSRAQALGAELHFSTPVLSVDDRGTGAGGSGGAVVVRTPDAEYTAPVAVVAAGAWAPSLLGDLKPITVTQEQVFHFPRRPAASAPDPWPTFIHHRQPVIYGLEAPGTEGVKVAEHHAGRVVDPNTRDFAVDPVGRGRVIEYVERWLPGLDPLPTSATTCLYDTTPTADFVIERRGNIVVAAGFSGHGFKFTPLIGQRLATLATTPP